MLYIHTVLVVIYRLRDRGRRIYSRLDPATGCQGRLVYAQEEVPHWEQPSVAARLVDAAGTDLLPALHRAVIRKIDGVMHLKGEEWIPRGLSWKSGVHTYCQSWLCALSTADAAPYLELARRPRLQPPPSPPAPSAERPGRPRPRVASPFDLDPDPDLPAWDSSAKTE